MIEQTQVLDCSAFPTPVLVRFGKIGLVHSVATVEEAAGLLRDLRWPRGQLHLQARFACAEAFEDTRHWHKARTAFIEAAKEAGILIGDSVTAPAVDMKREG
jgi:hypothetical protein